MIDDRLENWSRYYRTRSQKRVCASLEGNYRSNWRQWVELSDINHTIIVDWADAEIVESAWRVMLGIPKQILKLTYMESLPVYVVCRKSGIKRWRLEQELDRAKSIIDNLLRFDLESDTLRSNLNRASERISPIEAELLRPKEPEAA